MHLRFFALQGNMWPCVYLIHSSHFGAPLMSLGDEQRLHVLMHKVYITLFKFRYKMFGLVSDGK